MHPLLTLALCVAALAPASADLNKQEGDNCVWAVPNEGVFKGKCVNARKCFTTLDERGSQPPVCSTNGDEKIVCCTDCKLVNDTRNVIVSPKSGVLWKDGRKFRDYCLQNLHDLSNNCPGYYGGISRYLETGKKCHSYSLWGIGGPPAIGEEPPSVNPYEALVGFGNNLQTAKWKTSGVIISDKFVLTAGFTGPHTDGLQPKFVAVGVKHRLGEGEQWQTRVVKAVHVHPQYSSGAARYNYLALIELTTPIEFNRDVFPACLPDPDATFDVSKATYTPFVDPTQRGDVFEESRRKVEVELVSSVECAAQLGASKSPLRAAYASALPRGLDGTLVCYESSETVLGSPLVVTTHLDRCANTVVGVNVFNANAGPTVYADLKKYVPWIESVVWP